MTRQEENLEARLKNLESIRAFEVSEAYKLIIVPLKEKMDSLKHAYKMKAEEAKKFDGLWEGLSFIPDLLEQYTRDGVLAQEMSARLEAKKQMDLVEIDSRSL